MELTLDAWGWMELGLEGNGLDWIWLSLQQVQTLELRVDQACAAAVQRLCAPGV